MTGTLCTALRPLFATLLLATAACSGGDKIVSPDGTNSKGTGGALLNTNDSLFVINQIAGAAFSSIKALRTITVPTLPGLGAALPPCTPTVTGGSDANGNGIPDDKTSTYTAVNCTYQNNGATVVVTGTIRVQDLNGIYGYRVTYTNFNSVATKGDSVSKVLVNGTAEYAWVSATSARSLDNLSTTVSAQASTGSAQLARTANITGTFTPSGSNTIALNRTLPNGTLAIDGSLSVTVTTTGNQIPSTGQSAQTVTMSISNPTVLTASTTCTSDAAFDAGQLRATVGGSQTGLAVANFIGCGTGGSTTTTPSGGKK